MFEPTVFHYICVLKGKYGKQISKNKPQIPAAQFKTLTHHKKKTTQKPKGSKDQMRKPLVRYMHVTLVINTVCQCHMILKRKEKVHYGA